MGEVRVSRGGDGRFEPGGFSLASTRRMANLVSLRLGRKGLASDGLRLRCSPWRSQGRSGCRRVSLRLGRKGLASDGLRLRCSPWRSQGRSGCALALALLFGVAGRVAAQPSPGGGDFGERARLAEDARTLGLDPVEVASVDAVWAALAGLEASPPPVRREGEEAALRVLAVRAGETLRLIGRPGPLGSREISRWLLATRGGDPVEYLGARQAALRLLGRAPAWVVREWAATLRSADASPEELAAALAKARQILIGVYLTLGISLSMLGIVLLRLASGLVPEAAVGAARRVLRGHGRGPVLLLSAGVVGWVLAVAPGVARWLLPCWGLFGLASWYERRDAGSVGGTSGPGSVLDPGDPGEGDGGRRPAFPRTSIGLPPTGAGAVTGEGPGSLGPEPVKGLGSGPGSLGLTEPGAGSRGMRRMVAALGEGRFLEPVPVGRGGMGCVFRAEDGRLGRRVAVKVMDAFLADDHDYRRRFLREARILAGLKHPALPEVHDIAEGELPFLVMEWIEGRSLQARLDAEGPQPAARVRGWLAAAAEALGFAHSRGVVHRDVKPDNLLEGSDGRLRVIDFGVASDEAATRLTATGQGVGTPAFMAPEQLAGKPATPANDVWSLAATGWYLLAGRYPFHPAMLLDPDGAPEPTGLPADVPEGLAAALRAGLQFRVEARTPDMARFGEGLAGGPG